MDETITNTTVETLVAERCACCARVLRDAQSVERGIGPDCFQKYYDKCSGNADFVAACKLATECSMLDRLAGLLNNVDARGACNVILHAIACEWEHRDNIKRIELVRALGFDKLALRLEQRLYGDRGLVTVRAANDDATLVVRVEDMDEDELDLAAGGVLRRERGHDAPGVVRPPQARPRLRRGVEQRSDLAGGGQACLLGASTHEGQAQVGRPRR